MAAHAGQPDDPVGGEYVMVSLKRLEQLELSRRGPLPVLVPGDGLGVGDPSRFVCRRGMSIDDMQDVKAAWLREEYDKLVHLQDAVQKREREVAREKRDLLHKQRALAEARRQVRTEVAHYFGQMREKIAVLTEEELRTRVEEKRRRNREGFRLEKQRIARVGSMRVDEKRRYYNCQREMGKGVPTVTDRKGRRRMHAMTPVEGTTHVYHTDVPSIAQVEDTAQRVTTELATSAALGGGGHAPYDGLSDGVPAEDVGDVFARHGAPQLHDAATTRTAHHDARHESTDDVAAANGPSSLSTDGDDRGATMQAGAVDISEAMLDQLFDAQFVQVEAGLLAESPPHHAAYHDGSAPMDMAQPS